jgi:hypothetical protein
MFLSKENALKFICGKILAAYIVCKTLVSNAFINPPNTSPFNPKPRLRNIIIPIAFTRDVRMEMLLVMSILCSPKSTDLKTAKEPRMKDISRIPTKTKEMELDRF